MFNLVHHRQRCGTGGRVAEISVAMLEKPTARCKCIKNTVRHHQRANRLVACTKPLGDGNHVGLDAIVIAGEQMAGPAHAAHHLVEDQQHIIFIADRPNALEIAIDRGHRAHCCPNHRLGDEGGNRFRAEFQNLVFQLIGDTLAIVKFCLVLLLVAIGVTRIDVVHGIAQHWRKLRPPPAIAAGCQRTQRIAVIALPARDDLRLVGLAGFNKILSRQFKGGFHGFRPAGHEIDPVQIARCARCQKFSEFFGGL